MADRYAVATGNWSATSVWSDSDGGAPGSTAPVAGDNAYLTATSGAITVTLSAAAACAILDCTGFTGTLAFGIYSLTATGNVTLPAGMSATSSAATNGITCNTANTITGGIAAFAPQLVISGSGTYTLDGNGTPWTKVSVSSVAKTITLASALAVTDLIISPTGSVTFGGAYDITATNLYVGSSANWTLTLVAGQTLTVGTILKMYGAGSSGTSASAVVTVVSSTASSDAYLHFNGAASACVVCGVVFTDVNCAHAIDNWYGGTLTRTTGITNRTSADIGSTSGGVYLTRSIGIGV